MASSYLSSQDPQLQLTDSLMGFICEQLEDPGFDMAPLLGLKPAAHLNSEPKPAPVPSLKPNPVTFPSIHSLQQDPYRTNDENLYPAFATFTPDPSQKHHQSFKNHFGTASSTNPVNFVYQNPGFPVTPCTGTVQGMVVPAFKCASAQSVAARARRKKISEKTHKLAKLIPGGARMNTAEMHLAGFNYVKFLQAQIGILAMMDSKEAREVPLMVEEYMRVSLGIPKMQEYLCAQGMCLVPKKLVENLTKEVKSNVVLSRDLSRFVESIGR